MPYSGSLLNPSGEELPMLMGYPTSPGEMLRYCARNFLRRSTEWIICVWMVAFGAELLVVPEPTLWSPTFERVLGVASEDEWGRWFITIGTANCVALFANGLALPYSALVRMVTMGAAVFMFAYLAHLTGEANAISAHVSSYLFHAAICFMCFCRAAGEAVHGAIANGRTS